MTTQRSVYILMHPLSSDRRRPEPDIDLRTQLESLSPGHEHVCERLKPEPGIYYFRARQFGRVAIFEPEGFAGNSSGIWTDYSIMVVEIAGDKLYFQTVSRTGQVVDSGPSGTGLRGEGGRSTRSSFTSPPKEFR